MSRIQLCYCVVSLYCYDVDYGSVSVLVLGTAADLDVAALVAKLDVAHYRKRVL